MKFYIYNLGCKVNSYESNIMKENLEASGYVQGNEDDSDIYIINTCTVTNTSDNKSLKIIRRVLRNHPNSITVACGCMTQVNSVTLKELDVKGTKLPRGEKQAKFFNKEVVPAMEALRKPIDKLEMIVEKDMWPMPSYGDMIFEV